MPNGFGKSVLCTIIIVAVVVIIAAFRPDTVDRLLCALIHART